VVGTLLGASGTNCRVKKDMIEKVPLHEKSKCIEEAERTKSANLIEIRGVT
jgi:hypothetical protein